MKQNSKELMDEMFALLLQGLAPIQIREKLGIEKNVYMSVCNDPYWHDLILGDKSKKPEKRIEEIKLIERDLFIALENIKMFEEGTKERAELTTRVNELQKIYSGFNVFNKF